jgi:hypothetical protein
MFSESVLRLAGVHHGIDLGELSPALRGFLTNLSLSWRHKTTSS